MVNELKKLDDTAYSDKPESSLDELHFDIPFGVKWKIVEALFFSSAHFILPIQAKRPRRFLVIFWESLRYLVIHIGWHYLCHNVYIFLLLSFPYIVSLNRASRFQLISYATSILILIFILNRVKFDILKPNQISTRLFSRQG